MKNAIILHGTGDKNTDFWFPYVKKGLEEKGYEVWLPQLPNAAVPNLKDWLMYVLDNGNFTSETVLIGHSAGSQLILSILENLNVQIRKAILVSGYAESLRKDDVSTEKPELNWEKIKQNVQEIVFVNSDNDPWQCDDKQGRIMQGHLGGTLIVRHGEGHMGSTTYNQPYKEFPLVLDLVDTDAIEVVPYDSKWPKIFEEETKRLKEVFKNHQIVVEHIGSTAIPGIAAKPVIDIMLGFQDTIEPAGMIKKLEDFGYEWWEKDPHKHVRLFFVKWNEDKTKRTHQIHAVHEVGSSFWKDQISFRDKLRADPALVEEYGNLKSSLVKEFGNNRHKYIEGKTAFVKKVLAS